MRRIRAALVIVFTACVSVGCVTTTLAPGAKDVKFTLNPADVAGCTPVGNISNETMHGDLAVAQNIAVGLNGNMILSTGTGGIAYRCSGAAAK
jgi:hypothetical protein